MILNIKNHFNLHLYCCSYNSYISQISLTVESVQWRAKERVRAHATACADCDAGCAAADAHGDLQISMQFRFLLLSRILEPNLQYQKTQASAKAIRLRLTQILMPRRPCSILPLFLRMRRMELENLSCTWGVSRRKVATAKRAN